MHKNVIAMLLIFSSNSYAGTDSFFLGMTAAFSSLGFSARDSTDNRSNGYRRERIEAVRSSALTYLDEGIKSDALEEVMEECRVWLGEEEFSDDEVALKIYALDPDLFTENT